MKTHLSTKLLFALLASFLFMLSCGSESDDPGDTITVYEDADGDGFGNPDESDEVSEVIDGFVLDNTDCDDTNADINPDANEIPDNDVDENCDGLTDLTWYLDNDEDGFGDPAETVISDSQPDGYVDNADDCDDDDENINPDAEEIPDNDEDENCDGDIESTWYEDLDSDTFGNPDVSQVAVEAPSGFVANGDDCDDEDANINPDATEIKGNDEDEDCDGIAQPAVCGDGEVDFTEGCDDGNTDSGDGCGSTCQFEACGNGIVDPGEDCDDGNLTDGDGCNQFCLFEEIGPSACSDGVDNDGDGVTDCEDPDCNTVAFCNESGSGACSDGVDNDNDGEVDCNDPGCSGEDVCNN